jgi:hypothetical protein
MDISKLLILQLLAHFLADFIFQTNEWSEDKKKNGFSSKKLYWHVLIVFVLSWALSFQWNFFLFALIISIIHLLIDGLKPNISDIKFGKIKPFKKTIFFVDQIIHLVAISLIVVIFNYLLDINPYFSVPVSNHHLIIIFGYLICIKPSNVFIKEVFSLYNLKMETKPGDDLLNAGKLIGNIERILTLTLLLMGQYEAIGFIIAGKSILRYEGEKTARTEYVLVGTLLSFGIAIIIGILILKLPI